jgi:hypothetical protein
MLKSSLAQRPLWLIVEHCNGRMNVLTVTLDGDGEALPVFSFREEAEMYLGLEGCGSGWRAREVTARELISVLYGPCSDVGKAVLDPLPGTVGEAMVGFVSLARKDFMRALVGERGPAIETTLLPGSAPVPVMASAGHQG